MLRQSGRLLKQLNVCKDVSIASRALSDQTDVAKLRSQKFPNALSTALKKGTGGRSSFNGTVVTVFGASGFVSSHLIPSLCRIGCQVIVPYRGEQYDVAHHKTAGDLGQVLFSPFYLRDEDSIYKAVKFSNVVINLIGKAEDTPSFSLYDIHVDGARRIAKVAREAGVSRLIHMSTLNANPNPRGFLIRSGSEFLRSKYYGEQAVREEFPNAIIFRPAQIYGEMDHFFEYYSMMSRYNFNKMYLWNKGFGIYKQPVFCLDLAKGMVNAIFDNEILGKTIDAVGCRRYELHDLILYIMRVTGRGDEYNYEIEELRAAIGFILRVLFTQTVGKYPLLSLNKLELEHITDELTPGNLTLEDLGVTLTPFEENAYNILKPLSRLGYYENKYGVLKEPIMPKSLI